MCKTKKSYINILYVMSSIAVVLLHTNGVWGSFKSYNSYIFANIIECICYFAVPIFFMLSGANLINYRERYSTLTLYKKRIFKVFIPFIFWTFVSILCCIYIYKYIDINSLNIKFIFYGILNHQFNFSFWFFIPLFILYLLIPLLNYLSKYRIILVLLVIILLLLLRHSSDYFILSCLSAIIYALIGYILDRINLPKNLCLIIYIAGIASIVHHFIINITISPYSLFGYKNLDCILYSISIFTFIKNYADKLYSNNILNKLFEFLKQYTFAIYLLHYDILKSIPILFDLSIDSVYYRYIVPFEAIIVCIIITFIIRKLPLGKYILTK